MGDATAAAQARVGDPACLDAYARARPHQRRRHRRRSWTPHYRAWAADERAGRRSLLLAGDADTVRQLNERARAERGRWPGTSNRTASALHDGLCAGVGDRVVTRRNDRRLAAGGGWVKNGDTWTVTARHDSGALAVRRLGGHGTVVLPADYVAAHVDLAYATTAFRAQGADRGHRPRRHHARHDPRGAVRDAHPRPGQQPPVRGHRTAAANRWTASPDSPPTRVTSSPTSSTSAGDAESAHEARDAEREHAASIRTLAAEYETIASHAQSTRWLGMLRDAGLAPPDLEMVAESPIFGALNSALRYAEACGLPVNSALPRLLDRVTERADDPAAVLHRRIDRWMQVSRASGRGHEPDLVCGLLPSPRGLNDPEAEQALNQRANLISRRADVLLARARLANQPWFRTLESRSAEQNAVRAVAAYRERYGITDPVHPLGQPPPQGTQQSVACAGISKLVGASPVPAAPAAALRLSRPSPAHVLHR